MTSMAKHKARSAASALNILVALVILMVFGLMVFAAAAGDAAPGGIRAVDWRNFSYPVSPGSLHADSGPIVLHNGRSRPTTPDDFEISRLAAVRYADFRGDGGTEAAVEIITPVAARRGEDDAVYVFAWRGGRPRMLFYARYDAGAKIEVSGRSLVVIQPGDSPGDPPTRTILRWHGGAFRDAAGRRVG